MKAFLESPLENPWKTKSCRLIYNNPWIAVNEYQVVKPNGMDGIYGSVHFKNKAIGIVPLDKHEQIYLVGQYRYVLDTYSWEIPEGGGKHDEPPLEAAKRELKEETGLTAQKWMQIGNIHTSNSVTDEEGIIFLAEHLVEGETDFDDTEVIQVKKIALSEAVELVMSGTITDSLSIAGILQTARMKQI